VLGGKWKTVIMCYLKVQPLRYAELRKLIPSLSDKMLTQRLHELVEAGLLTRRKASNDKADAYVLSVRGQSLSTILVELYSWGDTHAESFGVKVGQPLKIIDGSEGRRETTSLKKGCRPTACMTACSRRSGFRPCFKSPRRNDKAIFATGPHLDLEAQPLKNRPELLLNRAFFDVDPDHQDARRS